MKLLILSIVFLSGCATAYMRNRDCHDRTVNPQAFNDSNISLSYEVLYDQSSANFTIENKTDKMMKIIWDESSFIDEQGLTNALFAGEVKIADRGGSIPPTIIQPKSKVKVAAAPKNKVEWSQYGWEYAPLCGKKGEYGSGSKLDTSMCENKPLFYKITYEVDGKKKTTSHQFKMTSTLKKACEGYDLNTGEKIKQ